MKTKRYGKIIACILAVAFALSAFAACNKNTGGDGGGNGGEPAATGKNIVENGSSEYQIVIPADADSTLSAAVYDFQNFIELSTGVTLAVVDDRGLSFGEDNKYISLGNTEIFKGSGLTITDDMLDSGYYLKTFGNQIVAAAKTSYGSSCAAYDLLGWLIGFECYAEDEQYYEEKSEVALYDFDIKFIPSFDYRALSYYHLNYNINTLYRQRMRLYNKDDAFMSWCHTMVSQYIKKDVYYSAHSDWYAATGDQVCYANEEMRTELIRLLKEEIAANPTKKYITIGAEDNFNECNCAECTAAKEQMGGYGGQQLDFVNKVAKELDPWLQENYPGREVYYTFFAYQTSRSVPDTAEYWNSQELNEHVCVFYAPIELDFSKPLDDEVNRGCYDDLIGWSELLKSKGLTNNIILYTYSIANQTTFAPLDNFGISEQHYKVFATTGVQFIYDQAYSNTEIAAFEPLDCYTQSKMMYDVSLSYNDLVNDFMAHYYDGAEQDMFNYYNFVRAWYKHLEATAGLNGVFSTQLITTQYWTVSVLKKMIGYLDDALRSVEAVKETDPERYETLVKRINREKLSPVYIMFELYFDYMTQSEKEEYIALLETCADYDIRYIAEHEHDLEGKIAGWRQQVYA